MSFRIEDILKTEVKKTQNEQFSKSSHLENEKKRDFYLFETSSILQKTLNRPQVQYYRSRSEPENYTNWGTLSRSQELYDHDVYKPKAISCPNIYLRPPSLWPNYHLPVNFLPQFYHFSKRKGGQVRFTAKQTDALEKRFTSHKYLSPEDRKLLADSLKLTDRQVKTWFQNRRAKWRRCNSVSSTEISSTRFEDKQLATSKKDEMAKSRI